MHPARPLGLARRHLVGTVSHSTVLPLPPLSHIDRAQGESVKIICHSRSQGSQGFSELEKDKSQCPYSPSGNVKRCSISSPIPQPPHIQFGQLLFLDHSCTWNTDLRSEGSLCGLLLWVPDGGRGCGGDTAVGTSATPKGVRPNPASCAADHVRLVAA